MDPSIPDASGFGAALAQSVFALAAVCALAWWALRWGARRGVIPSARGDLEVIDRAALDPGRAVYLVRVAGRVLVLGGAEQSLSLLAELRPDELPERAEPIAPQGFGDALRKLRGRA